MATFYRLIGTSLRWLGFKNIAVFTLLALGLGSLVYGLELPVFTYQSRTLALLCLSGLLFGWLLVEYIQQGWLAGILAFGIGGLSILLSVGRLWKPLYNLFASAVQWLLLVRRVNSWSLEPLRGITELGLKPAWSSLIQGIFILFSRAWLRLLSLVQTQTSYDPLADLVVWSLIVFLLAVWAVWWTRRRNRVLLALLPTGIILAVNLATSPVPVYPLPIWMAAVFILYALVSYYDQKSRWLVFGMDIADIQIEWALAVGMLAMASISSALLVPTISLESISDQIGRYNPVRSFSEYNAASTLQASRSSNTSAESHGLAVYQTLPNDHLLGSGPELNEQIVMWISLDGYTPMPVEAYEKDTGSNLPNPYWRGMVYDRYLGHGWSRSAVKMVEVQAGDNLAINEYPTIRDANNLVHQKVQLASGSGGILYSYGEPISATVPVTARQLGSGEIFGASVEFGEYAVTSFLPQANADVLRNSSEMYPEWVLQRYRALPEELPSRVRDLALDVTVMKLTPYDQAVAIESYLRTIPYTLDLPQPPPVSDLVDYYLFDLQRGFCDYSASAMVVLARAVGLPARLVIGYASGIYLPEEARFEVSAADAHAWPEIYFPDIGWVAFEPTGGRPPILRTSEPNDNQEALEETTTTFPGIDWESYGRILVMIPLISIALIALFILGLIVVDTWWLRHQTPSHSVHLIYRRLLLVAKRRLGKISPGTTPKELVNELNQRLITTLAIEHPVLTDTLTKNVQKIGAIYSKSIYSAHSPGKAEQADIIRIWIGLRYKLVRFLLNTWGRPPKS